MDFDLEWKTDYSVGIEEVDFQHRYFLKLIRRFAQIGPVGMDPEYQSRLTKELAHYAVFHFYSEENLMIFHNYPLLNQHHKIHVNLIDELNCKIQSIRLQNIDTIDIIMFLVHWFKKHTVEEDRKFGLFLENKLKIEPGDI